MHTYTDLLMNSDKEYFTHIFIHRKTVAQNIHMYTERKLDGKLN